MIRSEEEEKQMDGTSDEYTHVCLEAVADISRLSKGEYRPTRWLQMVKRDGGVAAAKKMLRKPVAGDADGGSRLSTLGLDHLSFEWSVLDPRWNSLFDDEDRQLAYDAITKVLKSQGAVAD
jgi:hypothetical protein